MGISVIILVLCLLVIQCGCHWSQLKATYLLTYHGPVAGNRAVWRFESVKCIFFVQQAYVVQISTYKPI